MSFKIPILCGEFREKSLKNLSVQYLFDSKSPKSAKTYHSKEWNALVTVLSQKGADIANKETVRQYFNIPQGDGNSIIVLANKKNLIERIVMDPSTLDIIYLDSKNNEVSKASLSAGEKQLMVIAILWALAICSKKKLPVIIDTPLSRLDSIG